MRAIYEKFTENEWKKLQKAKGEMTWHEFIMGKTKKKKV